MARKRPKGIYKPKKADLTDDDLRVADFSYQNDSLAQLIVDAWLDQPFRDALLERRQGKVTANAASTARSSLMQHGLCLSHPVVITEAEYNASYEMSDDDEVVFVLPNRSRVQNPASQSLLDTARMLMACTPNGI
ncbi:MAG: hypothetical protein ACM3N5_01430 [Candidatus Eiseniibacteriota bacterium]